MSDKPRIEQERLRTQSDTLVNCNEALLAWLEDLRNYGLALVTELAPKLGEFTKVTERISFMRESNYGTVFEVNTTAAAAR